MPVGAGTLVDTVGARVLVIDNYDSFVYNLVQELGELGAEPTVHRNDAIDIAGIRAAGPDAILISPGTGPSRGRRDQPGGDHRTGRGDPHPRGVPGPPGHGTGLRRRRGVRPHAHARQDLGHPPRGPGVFAGLPDPFTATRYHSLVVEPSTLPDVLEVTATTADGVIMGLRHRELDVEGVQFHPESILTLEGPGLLANFLAAALPA